MASFEVQSCRDKPELNGVYKYHSQFHEKGAYKSDRGYYMYFWDPIIANEQHFNNRGWWIAQKIGGNTYSAFNPAVGQNHAAQPPKAGWKVGNNCDAFECVKKTQAVCAGGGGGGADMCEKLQGRCCRRDLQVSLHPPRVSGVHQRVVVPVLLREGWRAQLHRVVDRHADRRRQVFDQPAAVERPIHSPEFRVEGLAQHDGEQEVRVERQLRRRDGAGNFPVHLHPAARRLGARPAVALVRRRGLGLHDAGQGDRGQSPRFYLPADDRQRQELQLHGGNHGD
ncbi:unnamed protein product [Amoebophrya sp. A120]|nr:unnamed protein product [Amoebophrya sp. A120]|eukprot:GSA120T00003104001.1